MGSHFKQISPRPVRSEGQRDSALIQGSEVWLGKACGCSRPFSGRHLLLEAGRPTGDPRPGGEHLRRGLCARSRGAEEALSGGQGGRLGWGGAGGDTSPRSAKLSLGTGRVSATAGEEARRRRAPGRGVSHYPRARPEPGTRSPRRTGPRGHAAAAGTPAPGLGGAGERER